MVASQQDKQQVEALIHEWSSALAAKDVVRVKALWDQDYPQLMYIAEENNHHLGNWAAISEYYEALPSAVESMEWQLDNMTIDVLGDVAYAYFTFVVSADVIGMDHQMVFDGRNTVILRKVGGQWKFIHYHESLSRDHSHDTWGFLWS